MKFGSHLGILHGLDHGSSLVEAAVAMPLLLLILLGAVDLARGYFLAMEIAGAANAGAEYGSQNPTDITGMRTAATGDAADVPNLVASPTYGCGCSDGSSFSASCAVTPSCATNVVYRVTVDVSATYTPQFPWPGIPSSIPLSSSATMRGGGN
jgi:Flp pilus assembly protein TadG